ncbi:MAG: transglutaminaseTgpA domain-containing protein [Fimbriimonadales bacterium]
MALNRAESSGLPPLAVYGAVWLLTLACALVVQLARTSEFSATPFIILASIGVAFSAWASRFTLSESARVLVGVSDALIAALCVVGQSFLNSLFGVITDSAIESYLSLSFLWYLCLRSALMFTMHSLVFQSVPALALFGLIATYMLAAQILWLFALMLLAMLFLMLASHRLEWGLVPPRLETGYALRAVLGSGLFAGITAFVLAPLLALTIGQLISSFVVGMPFRANLRPNSTSEAPPELQAGAGAVALSKLEVMRVRLEGAAQPEYMRVESYNYYTGRGWNRGRYFMSDMALVQQGVFAPQRALNTPPSRQVQAIVTLSSGWHRYLYTPGTPLLVEAPVRALQYAWQINAVSSYRPLGAGEQYTVTAYVPTDDPRILRAAPAPVFRVPLFATNNKRLQELATALTANQPTQYDKVMAIVRYIEQNTAYNLNVEAYPTDVDAVEYFLFEARQGYCVEFATALAVLCQYAGIPARVASGFILKEREGDEYVVREEHRHLWTEVYFENVGWVAFDATRNAPVIEAGQAEMQAQESAESAQARRRLLQRMLDALIAVTALAIVWVLVAPRVGWGRRAASSLPQQHYQRLVFLLWLLGVELPLMGQTPRAYLGAAAARLRQQGSEVAPAVAALTPALMEYLYAAPERRDALHPEIAQRMRQLQRLALQELGVRRLILRLFAYGRGRVYGN